MTSQALLYGHKRWVLFPPSVPKEQVAPKPGHDRGGISWFMHMYQETQKSSWASDYSLAPSHPRFGYLVFLGLTQGH